MTLRVLHPGPLATIQDLGRFGYAHLGVSTSGAADSASLQLANRLVGNVPSAAAIEVTLGGLVVRCESAVSIALAGADCGGVDHHVALSLPAGTELRLGRPTSGLRTYLAVRGGLDVPPVLGSRSTDTLSGIGPPVLQPGDLLPVGTQVQGGIDGALALAAVAPPRLRVVPGPRDDWFSADALRLLTATDWRVRSDSSRVGVRLDGPPLDRSVPGELPSEATLPGALQVPPSGNPILLGADAPVTGGYPVIAVVHSADLPHCGQLRPGDTLRFRF
ncbi:biotin-dependent carboxylase-like uncharacterized protein [Jatrophihabitans sp. GAS493]|uniref:5-oxoprolinase subunit C family protein n=1 Tax=Jatrophihabitans sp. GAS493 TaxID=1907575 RepID=UPI000BB79A19|nr:biotin-dependent carboxyltransferase family protein [Jatrophihabitans sp. GAS493]SOD72671.1 biotin-dependent carboxylase-like uncharacterized protein [Jatrophihabitans sp. GAS493]